MRLKTKRLKQLIRDLRTRVPKKDFKFNMGVWKETLDNRTVSEEEYEEGNFCGTAACAAGLYCILHPQAALKLEPFNNEYQRHFNIVYRDKHGETADGLCAVAKYFGMSIYDAELLFTSYAGETPKKVARSLQRFLESKGVDCSDL